MLALGYRVRGPTGTIALQGIRDSGSTDPVSDTILCELGPCKRSDVAVVAPAAADNA